MPSPKSATAAKKTAPRGTPQRRISTKTLGQALVDMMGAGGPAFKITPNSPEEQHFQALTVAKFFADAKDYFTMAIQAGAIPGRVALGRGNSETFHSSVGQAAAEILDYRMWPKGCREVPVGFTYRGEWELFKAWAASQGLEVWFEHGHDGNGEHSWEELCVGPDRVKFAGALNLTESSVVISKDLVAKYGSAQAYLEHLQKVAGKLA